MSVAALERGASLRQSLGSDAGACDAQRIALVVPTYRRPEDLARCLKAVGDQQRRPDQLIVVCREGDQPTAAVLRRPEAMQLKPTVVTVRVSGVVAALNAALEAVDADIVAFTDDDAAPRCDWLTRIAAGYAADCVLGGLGGRDLVHQHGRTETGAKRVVGRLTWFGRCIGEHHLGVGPAREVDALKGVNMSFRVAALQGISFDARLRGSGAQVGNELGVSLAVKRRGWKLVYDPAIVVDHYPAVRHDEDQRNTFCSEAIYNAAFNEALLLSEHLRGWRRRTYSAWSAIIGHRASPGLLQYARLLANEPRTATARYRAARAGRREALRVRQ
jgi:cellulose synthase/poly-beta-1,6-N-acetylglucosamine synthase-like glycosyltransferase